MRIGRIWGSRKTRQQADRLYFGLALEARSDPFPDLADSTIVTLRSRVAATKPYFLEQRSAPNSSSERQRFILSHRVSSLNIYNPVARPLAAWVALANGCKALREVLMNDNGITGFCSESDFSSLLEV